MALCAITHKIAVRPQGTSRGGAGELRCEHQSPANPSLCCVIPAAAPVCPGCRETPAELCPRDTNKAKNARAAPMHHSVFVTPASFAHTFQGHTNGMDRSQF